MSNPKQVLFMHYTLPPAIGGIEITLKQMAELFAQQGYLVSVLAGKGTIQGKNIKTSIIPEIDPEHAHIRELQRILKLGVLPDNYEIRLQNLERKIEAEIGDIEQIFIHNIMSMSDNLLLTNALWNYIHKYPNKKYYFYLHDLSWLMEDRKPFLFDRQPWNLIKTSIPFVKYITISEYRRRQVAELFNLPRRNITVIPNGIKYDDFLKFEPVTTLLCRQLRLFTKFPLILIPARLLPRKNILRSLQIIQILRQRYPDLMAIVTGPFYSEQSDNYAYQVIIQEFIQTHGLQEQVVFLQNLFDQWKIPAGLNQAVVRDLYFLSHLVFYLSSDEGFGLPLLEASLARVPLVVSNLPVFREITNGECLLLPDDESVEYNAKRVSAYLDQYATTHYALMQKILQQYNWDVIWEQYLKPLMEGESGGGGN